MNRLWTLLVVLCGGEAWGSFGQQTTDRRMRFVAGANYIHDFNSRHNLRVGASVSWDRDRFGLASYDTLQRTETSVALSLFYTLKWKKSRLETGAKLEWLRTDYEGWKHNDFLPLPVANWEWQPGKKHNLQLSWTYQRQAPTLSQWLPWLLRSSTFQSVCQTILPEYTLAETLPLDGRDAFDATGGTDIYLAPLSSNLKLTGGVSLSNYDYVLTDVGRLPYRSLGYHVGAQLKSSFIGAFNFDVGGNFQHTRNRSTQISVSAVSGFANLYVQKGRWRAQAHGDLCRWAGDSRKAKTYGFVDAEVSFEAVRNRLTLIVRGENLLDTDTYVEESVDEFSHTVASYRLQPRRILFLAQLRF